MPLEHFLSTFHWQSRFSCEADAPPQFCYDAMACSPINVGMVKLLIRMRGMDAGGTLTEFFRTNGFTILEELPPHQIVVGLIAKPWRWDGGKDCPPAGEWNTDGYGGFAKIVAEFKVEQMDEHRCRLSTETRVRVDERSSRWKFALYWMLVKPFSNLIRRQWLRQAKRLAEERYRSHHQYKTGRS
ncbi:MAG: hypothetical protein ACKVRP_09460 [Bacteroidota bacterium]